MHLLFTGFDPFDGAHINPAFEAVRRMTAPEGAQLLTMELPTVFGRSAALLQEAILKNRPDAVVMVGQAGGRDAVTVERVALNLMDATIADNEGQMPVDQPVVAGGENALFATLPVKELVQAVRDANVPARLSNTAGTFVCNALFYATLHSCKTRSPKTKAVFIHLPFLPEQTLSCPQYPSMKLEDMVRALNAVAACLAKK